jgi:predicted nucleotidyltransferase
VATLADTSLSADERALLARFVLELRSRLGEDLHAVWLFGSRARGERPEEDSDVDDASWDGKLRVHAAFDDSTRGLDLELAAVYFSVHVKTPESLVERRAIAGLVSGRVAA